MQDEIKNMQVYIRRMRKSLLDKLFFLDKTYHPIHAIVDFGCANGDLIYAMQEFFPEYRYIGYDINSDMIAQARTMNPDAAFFDDWDELIAYMQKEGISPSDSLINASSVIHEVYSYCEQKDIDIFWQRLLKTGFRYVAIRDMMLNDFIAESMVRAPAENVQRAQKYFPEQVSDFSKVWGDIVYLKNFVHFALKYKYKENWDREVRENYFPITTEQFNRILGQFPYATVYSEHSVPPYIRQSMLNEELRFNLEHIPMRRKVLLELKRDK